MIPINKFSQIISANNSQDDMSEALHLTDLRCQKQAQKVYLHL